MTKQGAILEEAKEICAKWCLAMPVDDVRKLLVMVAQLADMVGRAERSDAVADWEFFAEMARRELKKLREEPEAVDMARNLMDSIFGDLCWLLKYDTLSDGKKKISVSTAVAKVQEFFEQSYEDATGEEYVRQGCRRWRT